jgi:anti-sigma regulatory factor (Ser/Thr protein kinase)
VGGIPHQQNSVVLPPGSTLVLYTDGLIETPGSDIGHRLTELTTALDRVLATTSDLETAAEHVLTTMLPGAEEHTDDVTLLLARLPAAPLAVATTDLPAVPSSVPEARVFVGRVLSSWDTTYRANDAQLLASEILTNAVLHAEGPLHLHMRRNTTELAVEISDRSPHLPHPRLADVEDESGRGLLLVDALADNWGVRPTEEGKTTWFTLSLSKAGQATAST